MDDSKREELERLVELVRQLLMDLEKLEAFRKDFVYEGGRWAGKLKFTPSTK